MGGVYRKKKTNYNCNKVNDKMVELGGNFIIIPARQTLKSPTNLMYVSVFYSITLNAFKYLNVLMVMSSPHCSKFEIFH